MAKAQAGRIYAQIQNGRCHWIFTADGIGDTGKLPEYNEHQIQVVDVTGNVPNVGDDWTGAAFVPHVKTPEELVAEAAVAAQAALHTERQQIKADAFVQNFVAMTPAQLNAYLATKKQLPVANMAQANAQLAELWGFVEKMAMMQLVLAKREFK